MREVDTADRVVRTLHCGTQALRRHLLGTRSTKQKLALCDAIYAVSHAKTYIEDALLPSESFSGNYRQKAVSIQAATKQITTLELATGRTTDWLDYVSNVLDQTVFLEPISPKCNSVVRWALKEVANAFHLGLPIPTSCNAVGRVEYEFPYGEELHLSLFPAREPPSEDQVTKLVGPETMLSRLHRQIFGIEISAAEICAAIPLFFGPLPSELDHVLAIQTFEEGRHAHMFMDVFLKRGGHFSDFAYPTAIWNNFTRATNIEEALYVEQVLGEGYSIGADFFLADFYENRDDREIASIYRYVAADELMHAEQGLKWYRQLVGTSAKDLEMRLSSLAGPVPGDKWFFPELRQRVGFTEHEIEYQRSISVPLTSPF